MIRHTIALFLLSLGAAIADAPQAFDYQGYLTDQAGAPIEGEVQIEFRIYAAETGGSPLWQSVQTVSVEKGLFSAQLGENIAFAPDLFDQARFLTLVVSPDADEMTPRRPLSSSPFALVADASATADVADDVDCAGCVDADELAADAMPVPAMCYTRWGVWGCASGFTEVQRGRVGGFESYSSVGGDARDNLLCVDHAAATQATFPDYNNRFMRADVGGDGMQAVKSRCTTCCTGGCFTLYGDNSCPTGYTRTVNGRLGGVEAYFGAGNPDAVCIDLGATAVYTWVNGYQTRLFRFPDPTGSGSNGMEVISNSCAVCCKR